MVRGMRAGSTCQGKGRRYWSPKRQPKSPLHCIHRGDPVHQGSQHNGGFCPHGQRMMIRHDTWSFYKNSQVNCSQRFRPRLTGSAPSRGHCAWVYVSNLWFQVSGGPLRLLSQVLVQGSKPKRPFYLPQGTSLMQGAQSRRS